MRLRGNDYINRYQTALFGKWGENHGPWWLPETPRARRAVAPRPGSCLRHPRACRSPSRYGFQEGLETYLQVAVYAEVGANHCVDHYQRTPFGNILRSDGSGTNDCVKHYQGIPFGNALRSDALRRYSMRSVAEHHGLRQGMLVHKISIRPPSCKQRQVPH